LASQTRRAAASIPADIAEGCGTNGDAELRRLLTIAMGSASELEYLLVLGMDLGLLNEDTFRVLMGNTIEVKRILAGFMKKLKADH
jgi:four helix bundle protein